MNIIELIIYRINKMNGIQRNRIVRFLFMGLILSEIMSSCRSDPYGSNWYDANALTIYQYLEANHNEYSKFYSLLDKGNMLMTLSAYNPYDDGYTLFLPTDEAVDHFIQQNPNYNSFEELLKDTSYVKILTRYHTVNRKVNTDEFPYGALNDKTLTGNRLVIGFYTNGDDQLIKINNVASIIKPNLDMVNGYINVVSEVLQPVQISGYDWIQQQDDYSILAQAMELAGISKRMWFSEYTVLAEKDSVYYRNGIFDINDLIQRVATPGKSLADATNPFYQFTAYHILYGEYYLNDLYWGSRGYRTMGKESVIINVGYNIKINPGVDVYGTTISESGDTTIIDYIRPIWEECNVMTRTGPIHSLSDLLVSEPLP